jgi:hypothetical protein
VLEKDKTINLKSWAMKKEVHTHAYLGASDASDATFGSYALVTAVLSSMAEGNREGQIHASH